MKIKFILKFVAHAGDVNNNSWRQKDAKQFEKTNTENFPRFIVLTLQVFVSFIKIISKKQVIMRFLITKKITKFQVFYLLQVRYIWYPDNFPRGKLPPRLGLGLGL